MTTFTWEEVAGVREGDVFEFRGKRYRLKKKTTTAIAVERYYWFDVLAERLGRKISGA